MDFDLSDEQRLLKEASTADRRPVQFEQRKQYMAEPGRLEPRAVGAIRRAWACSACRSRRALAASAAGAVETMIVMEAFGRGLVARAVFRHRRAGRRPAAPGGAPTQRAGARLPQIAAGKLKLAFAHVERQSRYDLADVATTRAQDGGGWVLNGAKSVVLHGDCADKLIVTARMSGGARGTAAGIGLFLVDADAPGVSRRGYPDPGRPARRRDHARRRRVGADAVLGEPATALPLIEHVVDEAIAALCAEAVGAMEAMHEMTVEYLKTRKQFGGRSARSRCCSTAPSTCWWRSSRRAAWRCSPP